MSILRRGLWRALLPLALLAAATGSRAEDIDIFTGTAPVDDSLPNIIFVLDNTSNWARQSQQWENGLQQGQSEVRAIATALAGQIGKLNVGLMMYTTGGTANQNGAYVRFDLQVLTEEAYDEFVDITKKIFDDVNTPEEKRNSNEEYGYLMYDFYNYLDGAAQSYAGGGTPNLADTSAYQSNYSPFASPLTTEGICADTYMIFIGNPNSSGPAADDAANSTALRRLYEAAGASPQDALAGSVGGVPLELKRIREEIDSGVVTDLGVTAACYGKNDAAGCTAAENQSGGLCDGYDNCACVSVNSKGSCGGNSRLWNVQDAGEETIEIVFTGETDQEGGRDFNLDDWTKFFFQYGVPYTVNPADGDPYEERVKVVTYAIDVFNKQPNAETSSLYYSASKGVGGGKYFQAKDENAIVAAINSALGDILSEASSFAAVTLPLSATNRARVDNQVYIGMFRPAKGKEPRWYGNLKRYQLGLFNNVPELADVNLNRAINPLTGFAAECAESFWSSDSGAYWDGLGVDPAPQGNCLLNPDAGEWSDLPDGPFVEKGGVGQQIRELEAGADRTLYTVTDADALQPWGSADTAAVGGADVVAYLFGEAPGDDGETMPGEGLRASVHGDIVHSRPLSVRYDADTIALFYGANDGLFRKVDAATGAEDWALVPPELYAKLGRLDDNSPLIKYTGIAEEPGQQYAPKDYYFDGPTGQFLGYDENGSLERAYIYPTMRRGGSMIYALDVSTPDAPEMLWRKGCYAPDPDAPQTLECDEGFEAVGQSWSMPVAGFVQGYDDGMVTPTQRPIVIYGGGYDSCLDEDVAAYPAACGDARGKGVYILDAESGVLLNSGGNGDGAPLPTDAPVIAEAATVDIDFDGNIDFAYVADVAGGLYRINFATLGDALTPEGNVTRLEQGDWTIDKIASMSSNTRRFYNAPTVGAYKGTVVITIGSGDRERPLEQNYPYADDVQNRFYVFFDQPSVPYDQVDNPTVDLDSSTSMLAVVAEPQGQQDLISFKGWYMDLPDQGEQVVNAAAIGGGYVFFNTFQPGGTSDGLCTKPLGIGTAYGIPLFNPVYDEGSEIVGGGLPIPPIVATVEVPPGREQFCAGEDCPDMPSCEEGADCRTITVCIGCEEGFNPVEIAPDAPPIRRRVYFTEELDAEK